MGKATLIAFGLCLLAANPLARADAEEYGRKLVVLRAQVSDLEAELDKVRSQARTDRMSLEAQRADLELLLRKEMVYLQHRCHRLIWLNPLLGKSNYQPLVEGMAAALPFIDDFLPIHNLQSLTALSKHLAALGQVRSVKHRTRQLSSMATLPDSINY